MLGFNIALQRFALLSALLLALAPAAATAQKRVSDGLDARIAEVDALLQAQDWTDFYPFWFDTETQAPYSGFADIGTRASVEDGALVFRLDDIVESFPNQPPLSGEAATGEPERSDQTTFVKVPLGSIGEITEVRELTLLRLGPAEMGVDAVRSARKPVGYERVTVYEIEVRCVDEAGCIEETAIISIYTDGVAGEPETSVYTVTQLYLMAPTFDEAVALREALTAALGAP